MSCRKMCLLDKLAVTSTGGYELINIKLQFKPPCKVTIIARLRIIYDMLYKSTHRHHHHHHIRLPDYTPLRLGMWQSSNSKSTTFELWMVSLDSKFDECFKCFVVECEFVEKSLFCDWFYMHRPPASADKPVFFSNSTYHTNYSNIW